MKRVVIGSLSRWLVYLAVLFLLAMVAVALGLRLRERMEGLVGGQTQDRVEGRLPPGLERRGDKLVRTKDGMEVVRIPAGIFRMGSEDGEEDQRPVHAVTISKAFYLDRHEVTNAQYAAFMNARWRLRDKGVRWVSLQGEKASAFLNPQLVFESGSVRPEVGREQHPVIWVTWHGAQAYCAWSGGSLPTEAQWEYAARGGTAHGKYAWGDDNRPPRGAGNLADETAKRRWPNWATFTGYDDGFETTSPVCAFEPNGYGLCDMIGNVWEWVGDWWAQDYYQGLGDGAQDPQGPPTGSSRVFRGSSWGFRPAGVGLAYRGHDDPDTEFNDIGFRCAMRSE